MNVLEAATIGVIALLVLAVVYARLLAHDRQRLQEIRRTHAL